jgi:hypothetical protein
MKCIKDIITGEVKRVPNHSATILVNKGTWKFVQKIEWKAAPGTNHAPISTPANPMSEKKISNHAARINTPPRSNSRRSKEGGKR